MKNPVAFLLLTLCVPFTLAIHLDHRDLNAGFLPCYDYIIAGAGISGLVVANRLSEDPNVTVLVLEAGGLDNYEDTILYPIDDGSGMGTKYDWNLWTTPQTFLDNSSRPYDMGRGVGGGSLINGMCWTRGNSADYDAWVALGNSGWGWDDLLPYFKKVENYANNVDAEFSRELYIQPDPSTHGTNGYVHVSYPRYFFNQSQLFLDGLQELGIPTLTDPNNGTAAGGMLIPDSISPDNQTRSDARLAYYDGFINRPNLHVATGQHVTRVRIGKPSAAFPKRDYPAGIWIDGVEFLTDGSLITHNVLCSREVILAAGAVHTPQILEFSGIGDPNILDQFNIPVVINIPGVGNNFQDHPYVGVVYFYDSSNYFYMKDLNSNSTLLNQAAQEYYVNKTGPWTAGAINTVAFPSLQSISQNWTEMLADALNQNASQHLLPGLDATIIAGYDAQKTVLAQLLNRSDIGTYEILNNNMGLLAVSVMHSFSRGSVHIASTNALQQPAIDPRYCANPLDCQILVEALLFNNKLINTTAMRLLDPSPYAPFFPNATSETLMPAIMSGIRTEFHGAGTTSMLPLDLGGVVNTHLRVYGTKNLRVVDAGIFPLVPAAHLQAPVYAVAEKAADIIKLDNAGLTTQGCGADSVFARPGEVFANPSSSEIPSSSLISTISSFSSQFMDSSSSSAIPSSLSKTSSISQLAKSDSVSKTSYTSSSFTKSQASTTIASTSISASLASSSLMDSTPPILTSSSIQATEIQSSVSSSSESVGVRPDAILGVAMVFMDPIITQSIVVSSSPTGATRVSGGTASMSSSEAFTETALVGRNDRAAETVSLSATQMLSI